MKVNKKDCTDEISTFTAILVRVSLPSKIFSKFGEKMSHCIIFDFKALKSLLKKFKDLLEKEMLCQGSLKLLKKKFSDLMLFILIVVFKCKQSC